MRPIQRPIADFPKMNPEEMRDAAGHFRSHMATRRSVRAFSSREFPLDVVFECIAAAASAPSGANRQPWHFTVVADAEIKRKIRLAAEAEEHQFYHGRAPDEWLEALSAIGTDEHKPFLETAPVLIVVFAQRFAEDDGGKKKNYYVSESVGIASGFLLAALHHAGLATLTHTPSPMGFLNEILGRPSTERAFLLIPVGFPADDATVPVLSRKTFDEVCTVT